MTPQIHYHKKCQKGSKQNWRLLAAYDRLNPFLTSIKIYCIVSKIVNVRQSASLKSNVRSTPLTLQVYVKSVVKPALQPILSKTRMTLEDFYFFLTWCQGERERGHSSTVPGYFLSISSFGVEIETRLAKEGGKHGNEKIPPRPRKWVLFP